MGKHLVQKHQYDYNAQAIFQQLQKHAKESTQADIESANLLSYITSVKLHQSQWRGTTHGFILHWCDKLRLHEGLVKTTDHFTGAVKMIMLQNAVSGIAELHHVKTQSAHNIAQGKQPLNFEQYKTLLLSAASTYDAKRGLTRNPHKRSINNNELIHDYNYSSNSILMLNTHEHTSANDTSYNIDTDFDQLQINENVQHRRPFRPTMSKDKWNSLSPTDKETWDSLPPRAKGIILGITKPNPNTHHSPSSLNLHDISAADYIQLVNKAQQQLHSTVTSPTNLNDSRPS